MPTSDTGEPEGLPGTPVDVTLSEIEKGLAPLRRAFNDIYKHVTNDAPRLNRLVDNQRTNSQYRADIQNAKHEAGPRGEWEPAVINDVLIYAGINVSGTSYLACSLGHLLNAPVSSRAVQSLSRTLIETTAKVWWILDPTISVRTRVQRALSDELSSAHQQLFALKKSGDVELLNSGLTRVATTVGFARSLGLPLRVNKRGEDILEDFVRPTTNALVGDFLASVGFINGAAVIYGWLSSATHGDTLHQVPIVRGYPEPQLVVLSGIIPILRMAVLAMKTIHLQLASYIGSSSTARSRPYDRIMVLLTERQDSTLPIGRY